MRRPRARSALPMRSGDVPWRGFSNRRTDFSWTPSVAAKNDAREAAVPEGDRQRRLGRHPGRHRNLVFARLGFRGFGDGLAVVDATGERFGESADLVLTAQLFDSEGRQSQKRREPFGPVDFGGGFVINVYEGATPNPTDPRKVAKNHPENLDLENRYFSGKLSWDLGFAELVATTGYIDNEWYQDTDIDMSDNAVQFQEWHMETDQFTQEVQLVSTAEGPWEWILGRLLLRRGPRNGLLFRGQFNCRLRFHERGRAENRVRGALRPGRL